MIRLGCLETAWYEQPVDDALAAVANAFICPNYDDNRTMYFNGNDAMMLREIATNDVVDVIGKIGEDLGAGGWADMTTNPHADQKDLDCNG